MSFNWYDIVVGIVLLWGFWRGIRIGFFGEILRVVGLVSMVAAALHFYIPAGDWLQRTAKLPEEPARLTAFVVIAVVVYLVVNRLRNAVHMRMKSFRFGALLENVGGAFTGVARAVIIMGFLTIVISLMRSPFWHEQVSKNSEFGAFVVAEFPSVAAVVEKKFPETLWFTREMPRREDPSVDER